MARSSKSPRRHADHAVQLLCSSDCTDGDGPKAGLVQATDGNFYGTTEGGASGNCLSEAVARLQNHPQGHADHAVQLLFSRLLTARTLTPGWCKPPTATSTEQPLGGGASNVSVRHGLQNHPEWHADHAVQLCARNRTALTATLPPGWCKPPTATSTGQPVGGERPYDGCGTVFKITPSGTLTTLHSFDYYDGMGPFGALVQASDGNFYGTTLQGFPSEYGTVFRLVSVRPCFSCSLGWK